MVETLEKTTGKIEETKGIPCADPEIRARVSKMLEAGDINQKTLAQRIGYSPATVSTYLNGTYPGDLKNLEDALVKYLNLTKINQEYKRVVLSFEKTSIAQRIFNVAQMCQLNGEIGICVGTSGLGKTTAIKQYAHEGSGVILVDPNEDTTPKAVLKQIAEQIKLPESNSISPKNIIGEIVKRLNNSGYLVIVDESENINTACFRMLRKIHDRCNFSFGLLFIGTEKLYVNLRRLQGEFSYITNRIGYVEQLDKLKGSDVELLVKQIFPKCAQEDVKVFEEYTNKNARILFNTIKRVHDLMASGGVELCKKTITSARNMLLH